MNVPNDAASGSDAVVLVETVNATRIVALNRARFRNALNLPTLAAARAALHEASADHAIRCVIICGTGGHFCSGADLLQAFAGDPAFMDRLDLYLDEFHALVKSLVACPKPTIAMMDGGAVGFGADLAFACDLQFASTLAYAQAN